MAYFRFMGEKVIFKSSSCNVAFLRGGNRSGAWRPGGRFLEEFREAALLMAFKVSDGRQRRRGEDILWDGNGDQRGWQ